MAAPSCSSDDKKMTFVLSPCTLYRHSRQDTNVAFTYANNQYIGETKEKVLKAMNQARGGILFIDEAYGILGSTTGSVSYGREAIDTLTGTITSADFKGNLLVIMAGYEQHMDALMANANPGFTSRFNKKRLVFPSWSAQQAGDAVISEIQRAGKTLTREAEDRVHHWCRLLERLPMWGSARDVFETILPSLYVSRANRLRTVARNKHSDPSNPSASSTSVPYEIEDVDSALASIAASRQKVAAAQDNIPISFSPAPDLRPERINGEDGDTVNSGGPSSAQLQVKRKQNVKHKIRRIDESEDQDEEEPEPDVWGALEVACYELGYDADFIVEFLQQGSYPPELLDKIAGITSCQDQGKICSLLDAQKGAFLVRMKQLIQVRLKQKSEEEARCQQKLLMMGRCPMNFEWLKEDGGWRCAGGSHWVSEADVEQFTL